MDTIRDLAQRLRRGEVTAGQLAGAAVQRLNGVGTMLNAVACTTEEHALAQAADADRRLAQGQAGVLCGIPWAPKDILATTSCPTGWGFPPFRDRVIGEDATVVRRLDDAGAVLVGKLAMIEWAGAGLYRTAGASVDGPCRNPWDLQRWAGGSSSGSAAAVAAGIVPFSIGSETGGSLVVPAAFCGVTALRPSLGLVSRHGALTLAWSMDKLGPIAHTAEDCATVLTELAGTDDGDPTTVDWSYQRVHRTDFRLGVLEPAEEHTAVAEAFEDALVTLTALGIRLEKATLPDVDLMGLHDRLVAGEIAALHEQFLRSGDVNRLLDDEQRATLVGYLDRPATSYARAAYERVAAVRAIRRMFQGFDAIVAPTLATESVDLDTDLVTYRHRDRGGNPMLGSVAGTPELTVPMGLGPGGLPVGLSIMGDILTDATVLRVGELFQEGTSWHRTHPAVPVDAVP